MSSTRRHFAALLASLTLVSVAVLLAWDAAPGLFPRRAHLALGALPLALIAISALAYQAGRRPYRLRDWVRVSILAAAFLFWAANQFLAPLAVATLFNDLAIALFVLDVFLTIVT